MRLTPLLALLLIASTYSFGQDSTWKPPYQLAIPDRWQTEHFPLPPEFAPQMPLKGMEDLRFAPGWGDSTSAEHWAYVYLWWLEGRPRITAALLETYLQDYYNGLVGRNIGPRKIPQEKLVSLKVRFRMIATASGDKATFSGTVFMLDYHTQQPMTLYLLIHWKNISVSDRTAVFFEVSPRAADHPIWTQLDALNKGLKF